MRVLITPDIRSWVDAHDNHLRLQATLASQKQILDAADARERDRNAGELRGGLILRAALIING